MKHIKIIIAAILTLTMTACTDTNTAEVSDFPDLTTTSTALTEDTTTAEETTTTTTTTAEITTVSETETETQTETTEAEQDDDGILDLSNYSGNFYDWELVEDMTVYDKNNPPVSDETLALAIEAVRESESFIKQKEAFKTVKYHKLSNGLLVEDEEAQKAAYKAAFDENGNAIIKFNSGVYEDFDGDGKKEAFIILESYLCPPAYGEQYIYTVFVNSDGDVEVLEEYSDRSDCVFRAIRYNGFMHMYIYYSDNVGFSSWGGIVYAVENGKAIPVWNPGFNLIEKMSDSAFIYASERQINAYSLCFWNDELKKYCALTKEEITTAEDIEALSEIVSEFNDTNFYSIDIIGGKYYSYMDGTGIPSYTTYEKLNREFVKSKIDVCGGYGNLITVKGINIDEAESKAIKINN